jgi:hypothetical protein
MPSCLLNCGRETDFNMRLFLKKIQKQFRANSRLGALQAEVNRAWTSRSAPNPDC